MVLFHTVRGDIEIGMVVAAWKGVRKPRLHSGETPINSCVAFRVVELDMVEEGDSSRWMCSSKSKAWVIRTEGLVTVLDCERSYLALSCIILRNHSC